MFVVLCCFVFFDQLIATDFEAQAGPIAGVHVGNYAFTRFAKYIGDKVASILDGSASALEKVEVLPVVPPPPPCTGKDCSKISKWMEANDLGLEGRGWPDEAPAYGRLPERASANVTDGTWQLSECSPSIVVRFSTNADYLSIKVNRRSIGTGLLSLTGGQDDIMPYNGRFGIDIYAEDESNGGAWRWFQTSGGGAQQVNETMQLNRLTGPTDAHGERKFTVYFPTHIAVDSLKVGVPENASLTAYKPYAAHLPVLIWASSIGQGGVVQNAGMPWISQVGRSLEREVFNFGFSGDCLMQPEVADYLIELKPSVFVVDCLPNMNAAMVQQRATPLFKQLRAGLGPNVPILVLEGHTYSNAWVLPSIKESQDAKRSAQKTAFVEAAKTDQHIHYVEGDGKLASLGDGQYDATSGVGIHPSNIAHYRIGEYVATQIKSLPDWESNTSS